MNDETTSTELIRITIDVPLSVADWLEYEAKENKRSRKAQLELTVQKHVERYARRQSGGSEQAVR